MGSSTLRGASPTTARTAILTFKQLLHLAGLDPKQVRLLRHKDSDPEIHRALYEAAISLDPRFESYQEHQNTPAVIDQFRAATHLAAFVVEPTSKATVFVGVWRRGEERPVVDKPHPFIPDKRIHKGADFRTERVKAFDLYCGRLVIEWGDGTRAWVQRADNKDKPITELRRTKSDPPFEGFLKFQHPLHEIAGLYASWVAVLRSSRGIYLLVRRKTGQQYVGSATGADGFFGRWCCYHDGHGGNVAMRDLDAAAHEYDVSILEVASSDATIEDIYKREVLWKDKLGSKVTGLNRN